jgi:hypothetical protein
LMPWDQPKGSKPGAPAQIALRDDARKGGRIAATRRRARLSMRSTGSTRSADSEIGRQARRSSCLGCGPTAKDEAIRDLARSCVDMSTRFRWRVDASCDCGREPSDHPSTEGASVTLGAVVTSTVPPTGTASETKWAPTHLRWWSEPILRSAPEGIRTPNLLIRRQRPTLRPGTIRVLLSCRSRFRVARLSSSLSSAHIAKPAAPPVTDSAKPGEHLSRPTCARAVSGVPPFAAPVTAWALSPPQRGGVSLRLVTCRRHEKTHPRAASEF